MLSKKAIPYIVFRNFSKDVYVLLLVSELEYDVSPFVCGKDRLRCWLHSRNCQVSTIGLKFNLKIECIFNSFEQFP